MGLKRHVQDGTEMEVSPLSKRRLCSSRYGLGGQGRGPQGVRARAAISTPAASAPPCLPPRRAPGRSRRPSRAQAAPGPTASIAPPRRASEAEAAPQACDVCLEAAAEGGGGIRLGACGHHMCGSCAAAWCARAAARCLQQGAPLRCALPRCRRPVPLQQAAQLLAAAGVRLCPAAGAAYEAGALIPEEDQFTCPYPDCGVLSELEAALPDAPSACPSCGRGVCPCCRCMWHSGLRCSQYQALGAGQGGASAADKRCRVVWRRGERRAPPVAFLQPPFVQHPWGAAQPPASPMSP
ncbi:MAG: hypothetical protein J3K34DRAFT_117920 [Monoraphidium minutum]|nr:MAG: hypothetical protein J3K34DRAFT_117920 [Monoraphidium minutum]